MEKDRVSFRHSQGVGGGKKIERQANSFLQFPQAGGINYRQTLCLFTCPSWKQQEATVWDARGLG